MNRIIVLHKQLGIPENYGTGLPRFDEAHDLVDIGRDIFGRPQRLRFDAADAWRLLRAEALSDGVELQLVSAFRSFEYQTQVVQRKLSQGQHIGDILESVAAPGFSEHHSGRAIDITTPGYEPVTEIFEKSDAFAWLLAHGAAFSFRLSYPRDNRYGFCYEPWHWAYRA